MTHAPTKRRTGMSAVRAPLRKGRHRRDLLMFAGVGFSMLIIVALYAASFPKMTAATASSALPRWDVVREDVFEGFEPAAAEFAGLRTQLKAVIDAKTTQADSITILKAKLGTASATPETPNP